MILQSALHHPTGFWVKKSEIKQHFSQVYGCSLPLLPNKDDGGMSEKPPQQILTPTVGMEAHTGLGEVVHVVPAWACLDFNGGVPEAAIAIEAGAGLARDDTIHLSWVAAVQPDGSVGATVVLWDAEGGHGIPSHASETIPLPFDLAVTRRLPVGAVDLMVCVPPGLVQADVG